MRLHKNALDSYAAVQVTTGVATADSAQLILMLFDGFLESLAFARGHIQRNNIEAKSKALTKAGRIVLGLQSALDFDKGNQLAQNLDELYSYITRRLLHINANDDLQALEEVHGLMSDIREAWTTLPGVRSPGMGMNMGQPLRLAS
jgi:flagellar protein FliS